MQSSCGGKPRPSNGGGRRSRSSWPRRWTPSAAVDAASDADAVPELAADIEEHEHEDEDEHTACSCTSSSAAAAASWPSPPPGTAWPSIAADAAAAAATASTAADSAAAAAAAAACSHHRRSFAPPCSLLCSLFRVAWLLSPSVSLS